MGYFKIWCIQTELKDRKIESIYSTNSAFIAKLDNEEIVIWGYIYDGSNIKSKINIYY